MATLGTHLDQPRLPKAHGPQIVFLALTTLFAMGIGGTALTVSRYNHLAALDLPVQTQWTQLTLADQRRAEIVPALVDILRGAGVDLVLTGPVAEARAVLEPAPATAPTAQTDLDAYAREQTDLDGALAHLMTAANADPRLKGNARFAELRAHLENAEDLSRTERARYADDAQQFNAARNRFPNNLIASLFGTRFASKALFHETPRAEIPTS